jgi:hypothetical protein
MTVERHEFRNTNTTSTVSAAPSISAHCTFATELRTRVPASRTTLRLTPCGRLFADRADLSADRVGDRRRAVAFRLLDVDADGFSPESTAADRASSVPTCTFATSPSRTIRPLRLATTTRAKLGVFDASTETDRPLIMQAQHATDWCRDILRLQRADDVADADVERGQRARSQVDRHPACVRTRDFDFTDPADRPQPASDPGSASNVSCGTDIFFDASASEMIGKSVGLTS